MILGDTDGVLWTGAVVHGLVGLVCMLLLLTDAAPLLGVHPALKPMKFGLSIALFLGTMAVFVPTLSVAPGTRRFIAWTLLVTMLLEMLPIAVQPLRGTTSHFNLDGAANRAVWHAMVAAICVATVTMLAVALVASCRPLLEASGRPLSAPLAMAWRAALWLFLLAAVSGFAMGSRLRHSVGGDDGGPGLPLVNWSTTHGDLRVSHFVALHALQTLPLLASLLAALPLTSVARWSALLVVIAGHVVLGVWTLALALAARPWP